MRTNWKSPFLWAIIDKTARKVGYPWSPIAIANRLQDINPKLFASFRPQRISGWRDGTILDQLVWKPSVLQDVARGNRPHGLVTRHSILVSQCLAITPTPSV